MAVLAFSLIQFIGLPSGHIGKSDDLRLIELKRAPRKYIPELPL
ncbi:MAG: hypothetical protein ABJI00_03705 [Paracoccaceae bacterium]